MRHCENCGEELREGGKFYCGKPIPLEEPSEPEKPERDAPEPAGAGETRQSPGPTAPDGSQLGKWKKIVLGVAVVIVTLAVVAAVAWQPGIGEEPAEPATKEPTQAVDQDDLKGTLDWQEDQDKEYELKHSLIEGNPDSNVKEIFEESAYFIPKRHAYATDGDVAYYLIECEYDKDGKTVPHALVFQVNEDKHLELVELHKNGKKVGKGKFDAFYERLYETKDQAAAEKEAAREQASTLPKEVTDSLIGQTFYQKGLIYPGNDNCDKIVVADITDDTLTIRYYNYTEYGETTVTYQRDHVNYIGTDTYVYYKDYKEDGIKVEYSIQEDRDFNDGYWMVEFWSENGECVSDKDYFREGSKPYEHYYQHPEESGDGYY